MVYPSSVADTVASASKQQQSGALTTSSATDGSTATGVGHSTQAPAAPVGPEAAEGDVEPERDDPNAHPLPFDPERIRVRTVNILVDQIVSRIAHDEIDLAPEFQRASGIWDHRQQSRLIESLMLRIPIPVFYVAADNTERWSVVDGVQRISTLNRFVNNSFRLKKLEYLRTMEGAHFEDLPRNLQRRINETQLVVHVIEPGTPGEVMFNIFKRINTGGLPLMAQEIRHAMYPGPVRQYLKDLAELESFMQATANSINVNRMDDREFVLRFLAFYLEPWQSYSSNNIDGLFSRTMIKINEMDPNERNEIKKQFEKSMRAAASIFENDAFRKRYDSREPYRYPVNRALFEAWSVTLARCSESQLSSLVEIRTQVQSGFVKLMNNDREFEDSISYSTGTPKRVKKRFQAINDLVIGSLKC